MNPVRRTTPEALQFRLAAGSAAALLIVGVLLALRSETVHREGVVRQTQVQAEILADSISAALAFNDEETLREHVRALRRNPRISVVGVYGGDGVLRVMSGRAGVAPVPARPIAVMAAYQGEAVVVSTPVAQQGVPLGTVYLRTEPEGLAALFGRHGGLALLAIAAAAVLALLARNTAELHRRASALVEANDRLRHEMKVREETEEALRQSQKMEALGQLTGGVAHDFNNLLTVIMGGLETVARNLPDAASDTRVARLHRAGDMSMQAAQRAATLTKRLLAFSRQQPLEPTAVDLNRMVMGMAELLRRSLGEAVALETVLSAGIWWTMADAGQLENALLNLAVNARDAMPGGGKLTIETANAALDESYLADVVEAVEPGQYVMVAVTDTGSGMDNHALDHAFEPFFTTKEVGKGTGLGLSQVYGFVRQSSGHIRIYSEVGHGTTVRIYLPRHHNVAPPTEEVAAAPPPGLWGGDETILLVEDHDDLRAHSVGLLQELGYRVLAAPNGRAGLALLADHPEVALLFTDIVLPEGMNGRQLADAALAIRPDLKVLFTTGYTRNAIVHNGIVDPGVHLIAKPYSFGDLAMKVRGLLDARG
jgi:signal transduction histidine kinase